MAVHTLSLFAGGGGLDLGLYLATGGATRSVCFVEREAAAAAVLVSRMGEERPGQAPRLAPAPVWSDVTTFDARRWRGAVDLVVAGYPCFVRGTWILTRAGYRKIEDVCVGDEVLTHLGRWRRVQACMSRTGAPVRRVRGGFAWVDATDEHPFLTRDGIWVAAADTRGHRLGQVLPPTRRDRRSEAFWWLVGRYLADGWRQKAPSQRGGRVNICCARGEADDLERRIREAGFEAYRSEERTTTRFAICRRELYDFLGPFGHGAGGKRLSGDALALDCRRAEALLSGYLSGDGHSRGGAGWRASTVSHELALGLVQLAQRARGVVASLRQYSPAPVRKIEGRQCNQRVRWVVDIPTRNRSHVADGRYGWALCRESSPLEGRHEVFNIAVEEDESYVANGVIVHNCQPFSSAGKRAGLGDERWLWDDVRRCIRDSGAGAFLGENVGRHLSHGAERVAGDLVEDGFAVALVLAQAADVGAPHRRERLFILAARLADGGRERLGKLRPRYNLDGRHAHGDEPHGCDPSLADPDNLGGARGDLGGGAAWPAPFPPRPTDLDGWRKYLGERPWALPAVARDQRGLRGAPDGLAGGLDALVRADRVDRLRILGNGVVPQQAAFAFTHLWWALHEEMSR